MKREISSRIPTSYAGPGRSNQYVPLLTVGNKTCRDVLFLIAPECRRIMFEDRSQTRVAAQALIIQIENVARDSVSGDKSDVAVNRKEHSWTSVIRRHGRDYPQI